MIPKQFQDYSFNFVLTEGKIPFEKGWQKKVIRYDNSVLKNHLENGGNYGVICGGEKNLIVIDLDDEETMEEIKEKLPKTFVVKTGSGKYHLYYYSDNSKKFKIMKKNMDTIVDVQGEGTQVIAPNSIHPDTKQKYEILEDLKISFIDYEELGKILKPFDGTGKFKKDDETIQTKIKPNKEYNLADEISRELSVEDVLRDLGIDTSKNPTDCPFHSSKGGKCFSFIEEKWNCFHCNESGNIFSLIKMAKNLDSKGGLEYLSKLAGLEKEFDKKIKVNALKFEIELPGNDVLISTFANKLVKEIKQRDEIFFRQDLNEVVEITELGFNIIKSNRFITLVEKHFNPWIWVYKKNGGKFQVDRSMNQQMASIVLASPNFQDKIRKIKRIFPVTIPIIKDNVLTFPIQGYDERFCSWLDEDTPRVNTDMTLEEAKAIFKKIYGEFCFQENQDYINAIAGLMTPFLRGLYSNFNVRTPMFSYMANRERAGKDYCAGITGLVLEGFNLEESPISSGESRSSGQNDELRKKIVSAMVSGKKRFHSANNKGRLNNAVLEGVLTASKYSDRLLGKNEAPNFDNEIDYSMSGNIGMTFTADLSNRSRFVRLFLDIEDANQREFETPDLHGWVLKNRSLIISSIYTLIREWFDNGRPKGSIAFTSFPEWASICGGIMENAGIGNPCKKDKQSNQGLNLDEETGEMKEFFEYVFESVPNKMLSKSELKNIILSSDDGFFAYLDWTKRADQIRFGKKIDRFVGRILSDIRLTCDNNPRSARRQYMFSKEKKTFNIDEIDEKSGNVGNVGNVLASAENPIVTENVSRGKLITDITNITKLNNEKDTNSKKDFVKKLTDEEIKSVGFTRKELEESIK